MASIQDTSAEFKAALLDRVALLDNGTHPMKVVGVGSYCPEEDTLYLHFASTTQFRHQKNGKVPVQYSGWFYVPHLNFTDGRGA